MTKGDITNRLRQGLEKLWQGIRAYINVGPDLEPQSQIEASIRGSVSFRGSQLLVLVFSIFVASLGLNTDSTPVVIGAMLISPLMGPIIGMGLGIGIADYALLRRGAKNVAVAVVGSIATATLYFAISPQYEGASQLLARTSPSIYDVLIALFGGAAGIVSIACRNKGQVLPGVAIATSLMPPLCTAGYGLATGQWAFFAGALYLFFTNAVFILFASWIGVKLMGLKPLPVADTQRAHRVQTIVYVIVTATIALSCYLTYRMIGNSIFEQQARAWVQSDTSLPGTEVLSSRCYTQAGERHIDLTLIGRPLPQDSVELTLMRRLQAAGLGGTILSVKQGFTGADATGATSPQGVQQLYTVMGRQLDRRQAEVDSLQNLLAQENRLNQGAVRLAPEMQIVFPQIRDVALSRVVAAQADTLAQKADTVYLLMVNAPGAFLDRSTRQRIADYTRVRMSLPDMPVLLVNPSGFPWPQ